MRATKAAQLTLRQLDTIYNSVMKQVRQAAIDGMFKTVYYLMPEYGRKYYLPLIDKLKEDGYKVRFKHVPDPRDEDYSQITVSWKENIMDERLAKVQKELLDDSVETFEEMIDDLYKMAEKHASLVGRDGNNSELGRKYKLQSTIERNIAQRIEKTWNWVKKNKMIKD